MFSPSLICLALILTSVRAFGQLGEFFDFTPIETMIDGGITVLPSNHFSLYNSQSLLVLAKCLSHNINESALLFDVKNLAFLEEFVREDNKQKLIEVGACDESFLQCLPPFVNNNIERYIGNLILEKTRICKEIEDDERHYLNREQLSTEKLFPAKAPTTLTLTRNNTNSSESLSTTAISGTESNSFSIFDTILYILFALNCLGFATIVYKQRFQSNCYSFLIKNEPTARIEERGMHICRETIDITG